MENAFIVGLVGGGEGFSVFGVWGGVIVAVCGCMVDWLG